jgi:dolichyl-phosphate beta-glucosyltransferase
MTDLPPIANFLSNCLLFLLIVTFIYALCIRFVPDETLYDRTVLPSRDPQKLSYYIEPVPAIDEPLLFPSIFDISEVYLSVVIPASNDDTRLPALLESAVGFLQSRTRSTPNFSWELIVADDCSSDKTPDIVLGQARHSPQIRLLRQPQQLGLGAALQAGCLHARGQLILTLDSDGGTRIDEFVELERKLRELRNINGEVAVFGSRSHLSGVADNAFLQRLLSLAGLRGVQETHFPIKLFSRDAARWIFPNQHTSKWCVDPELLVIAAKRTMQVGFVPVEWNGADSDGGGPIGTVKQAVDLLQTAVFYKLGMWTIRMKADIVQRPESRDREPGCSE